MNPFSPRPGATVSIDVSASSQRVKLTDDGSGRVDIRVHNAGSELAFINFGDANVTASLTKDVPLPAGEIEVLSASTPPTGALYAAIIAAGSTGLVYLSPGEGD